ncbi:MAG: hypothetical protein HZA00_10430 [Nitrospinae bacterium]|nr:hypothetical protein [Nitrospinota bacterium]
MDAKLVVGEILDTGLKLSTEKDRIKNIFVKSGVKVTGDMKVEGVDGDAISVLKKLMDNLTEMAVLKINAKQIIRKAGITI